MDKNKLPLIFPKIRMVIVIDETVLESWYGIFESVLSYGIIFRGFARNGKKLRMVFVLQNTALRVSGNSRVTPPPSKISSNTCRSHVGKQKVLTVPTLTFHLLLFNRSINLISKIFATVFNTRFNSQLTTQWHFLEARILLWY